jgi:Tfp pilus assembly protein FimT
MGCEVSLKPQTGVTLAELLVVLTLVAAVVAVGTAVTVPQIARQTMRSSLHTGGAMLRWTRTEAVKRDHACRFVVDLGARTMSVVDTQGTGTTTDDEILRQATLPTVVSVARPDVGSPITFSGSSPVYHVEFHADGYVTSGAGEMVFCSGTHYDKVTVYSAGGVHYQQWNGSSWIDGP